MKDQVELYGRGGVSSWDKATHDSLNNSTQLLEDSRRVIAQTEEVSFFSFFTEYNYIIITVFKKSSTFVP